MADRTIFDSPAERGASLEPSSSTPLRLVRWVTLRWGWHLAFLTTGIFNVLWILWWFPYYRKPTNHTTLTATELHHIYQEAVEEIGTSPSLPWRRLLRCRQTCAFSMAKVLTDPVWYFYLFWLPPYISAKFNLNLSLPGLPPIIVCNVSAIGSIAGGWLSATFRPPRLSPNYARLTAMLVCACLAAPICTASGVKSLWTAIARISIAAGAHQGWSANLFRTSSDMFPRSAVGSVVGIGGMAGSAGSALFAFFAGHILQLKHSDASLFGIAASAYLGALVVLCLLAPGLKKVEPTT
jgi:ACS family hexuronate transporter-like MFS transporter